MRVIGQPLPAIRRGTRSIASARTGLRSPGRVRRSDTHGSSCGHAQVAAIALIDHPDAEVPDDRRCRAALIVSEGVSMAPGGS